MHLAPDEPARDDRGLTGVIGIGVRDDARLATSESLQAAADFLFEERGFAVTTTQEIARLAGVSERTLFRHFAGKQDLLARGAARWQRALRERILARPFGEPARVAVERAATELAAQLPGASATWLLGPQDCEFIGKSAAVALIQFEQMILEVTWDRVARSDALAYLPDLEARLIVAALRSALIRDRDLRGVDLRPSLATLISQAFASLG